MPNKKIGLKKIRCMLICLILFSCSAFAQKSITGKVINKTTGHPIAGVTVQVKGTRVAAETRS